MANQRHHDLRDNVDLPLFTIACCADDRGSLHLGDFRECDAQSAAAVSQHRIQLPQALGFGFEFLEGDARIACQLAQLFVGVRQELM